MSTTTKVKPGTDATAYDWRSDMRAAAALKDSADKNNKKADVTVWKACQGGITEWLPTAKTDAGGEGLYGEFLAAYGDSRKGTCSKMRTIALAVKDHGLTMALFDSLSTAYNEARRLMQTAPAEIEEDRAAEQAVEALVVPNSASTPENAAKIVLSKGVDEAARLLLDALGATNTAAHRALLRAVSQEIAGRVKPVTKPVKSGPKTGAKQATPGGATKGKATAKPVASKAKPKPATAGAAAPAKAKPVPVSASKGDPNKKALPVKKASPVIKRPVPQG